MLGWLGNRVRRSDIDPDAFLFEIFHLRDELSSLGEVVVDERFTTITLYALPVKMYSTVKIQSIRDPELGFKEIRSLTKAIFINPSEKSVSKRNQESYRKVRNSCREPRSDKRKSATIAKTRA